MEQKTKLDAPTDRQEIIITREFDLPVEMLYKAYVEPEIVEQWMSTKVLKLENKKHGGWQFETTYDGKVVFSAHGVIHEVVPNQKITRTFEMNNAAFPPQIEYFNFEPLSENSSRLTMHIVFKSVALRDEMLKLPFAMGINMAHNRLQEIVTNLN